MIRLRFGCGHVFDAGNNVQTARCYCQGPGSDKVTRVDARAPRFTGTVTGPVAEFKNLEPIDVSHLMKGTHHA